MRKLLGMRVLLFGFSVAFLAQGSFAAEAAGPGDHERAKSTLERAQARAKVIVEERRRKGTEEGRASSKEILEIVAESTSREERKKIAARLADVVGLGPAKKAALVKVSGSSRRVFVSRFHEVLTPEDIPDMGAIMRRTPPDAKMEEKSDFYRAVQSYTNQPDPSPLFFGSLGWTIGDASRPTVVVQERRWESSSGRLRSCVHAVRP